MAVTLDAVFSGNGTSTNNLISTATITTTSSNVSGTITVGSGASLLIVLVEWLNQSDGTWTTATAGGVALTEITGSFVALNAAASGNSSLRAFGLLSPSSGSKTIALANSAASSTSAYVTAMSYKGTDTSSLANAVTAWTNNNSTTAVTATTGASPSSIASTSLAAGWFSDGSGTFGSVTTSYGSTNGGTLVDPDQNQSGNDNVGMILLTPTGGNLTITATQGATDFYAALGLAFNVPAAGKPVGAQSFDLSRPDLLTERFSPQLRGFTSLDRNPTFYVGKDQFNPGKQSYDTPPAWLAPEQFAQWRSFFGHYTYELIGKDKFNPGQQWYATPDAWLAPERWQTWRDWKDSYKLTLIAKDKFNPGAQSFALPDAWYAPETFAQWRSFAWQFRSLLIPPILQPPGAQLYSRWVDPQDGWAQWRSWTGSFDLNLIGQDKLNPGKQSFATPDAWLALEQFAQWRAYSWQYRPILVGQDKLNPGKQLYDTHSAWLIPDQWTQQRTYSWQYNPLLHPLVVSLPPGVQIYDRTFDPQDAFSQWRSFAWDRSPNLIFQDSFPVGAIWDDLSPRALQQGIDFEPSVNIALLTQVVVPKPAGAQLFDSPPPPLDIWAQWRAFSWYSPNLAGQDKLPTGVQTNYLPFGLDPWMQWRSFAGWYNLNLTGLDKLPPGAQTNYLPLGVTWRPESPPSNLLPSLLAFVFPIPPGKQLFDRQADPLDAFAQWRAWLGHYNLNLVGKDALPPGKLLYDRALDPQDSFAFWRSFVGFAPLVFGVRPPGKQVYDRALDPQDVFAQWRGFAGWYNLNLISRDALPSGKQSFDLPPFGYPPLVPPINYNSPLLHGIPLPPIIPVVIVPATYYMLEDHAIGGTVLQAGTIQQTADLGGLLPVNWTPSPNVDPIDAGAVASYTAAGYRPQGLMRTQFTVLPVNRQSYQWQLINNEWTLVKVR